VSAGETYAWSVTWCATSAAALERGLRAISVTFAIEGSPVPSSVVTEARRDSDGLACADYGVALAGWQGSSVLLSATLRLSAPVLDGISIYQAGDYVYEYVLTIAP
ncbi:MAG: hypothetical protein JNL42_05810, partial [Anaerolineae bacterium]|nr:hypothetical protein [Anaerolineae bacterium]